MHIELTLEQFEFIQRKLSNSRKISVMGIQRNEETLAIANRQIAAGNKEVYYTNTKRQCETILLNLNNDIVMIDSILAIPATL